MTETPKCPYCGAELEVTHAFVSNAVAAHQMVYTCFCRECGIYTPKRSTPEEALSAALHRAEPEMRPLTMGEMMERVKDDNWNFVWVEHRKDRGPIQLCPWVRLKQAILFCKPLSDEEIKEEIEEMGRKWRCWPRKPTPEQMAAVEWEE